MHRLIIAAMLVSVAVGSTAGGIPADAGVILLSAKFGVVTFPHRDHHRELGIPCATCHHTADDQLGNIRRCHDCHAPGQCDDVCQAALEVPGAPSAKDALHGLCRGCHERVMADFPEHGVLPGPIDRCRDCHE